MDRRKPIFDRATLEDPAKGAAFLSDVRLLAPPDWEVHAQHHVLSFNNQMRFLLSKHFPLCGPFAARRPDLSQEARDIISQRKEALKVFSATAWKVQTCTLRLLFAAWATAARGSIATSTHYLPAAGAMFARKAKEVSVLGRIAPPTRKLAHWEHVLNLARAVIRATAEPLKNIL